MSQVQRRALITGGSSGIGRCTAGLLAEAGCDVGILHADSPEEGQRVVQTIEALGQRAFSRVVDVADSGQVCDAVEAFLADFGGVDILVNSAGVADDRVIWKMTDEQWRRVIDIDLTGVFNCCRAVAGPMRKAGSGGAIVNIASINGLRGKFGQTNYSAAKAGVIGLTKALARELASADVTVNAIAPGLIETPMTDGLPAEARDAALGEILLGRLGQPEDVAELVVFLCSDRARFITGQTIQVDGGQYI
ncbi:3-oxoacyl-[acyl-carrier protein] reductase [hydrothermal vent metagenome]|uniref:3-oxoacyl-[acyl-carrier protein] reductase n=1 Tax=hydrothermal vent metagenome TaxID=652676 RepID=A0A3B1E1I4_9ZZZZ